MRLTRIDHNEALLLKEFRATQDYQAWSLYGDPFIQGYIILLTKVHNVNFLPSQDGCKSQPSVIVLTDKTFLL